MEGTFDFTDVKDLEVVDTQEIVLTEEEEAKVAEIVKATDITDTNQIIAFGADTQSKIADFSNSALDKVRTKDLGEVGESLTGLVTQLQGFNALEERKKGFAGLFHKAGDPLARMKANYTKAESNVEKVVDVLEGHQVTLVRDVALLDQLFQANADNFKQLTLYIAAGKEKLKEANEVTLPEMRKKAEETGLAEDAQAANDFANLVGRFEKRVHDLELTRTISLQMAPQIRMIQNNDSLMNEKIQSALTNTIPLWKSQMVLALGLANSEAATAAQRSVTDATNQLLKSNAEALKITTVEVAKESERGIVDLETLQETNRKLIETIDDVLAIQKEGHENRLAAEKELEKIEGELKTKLLETVTNAQ